MVFFEKIQEVPDDPILSMPVVFAADPRPKKVNLGIGVYKDALGKPLVFTAVLDAEKKLLSEPISKEYLAMDGHREYVKECLKLVFGSGSAKIESGEIFATQCVGGTGALRLAAEFFAQEVGKTLYMSEPSWPNHKAIFMRGGMEVKTYPYYDPDTHKLDFEGMCKAIKEMPAGSVILMHACCHNPTGVDPTFEQWKELSDLIKKQRVFPFFDLAYQGFGTSVEDDAKAIRYFVEQGHEMAVAHSCSKNFGLYGERLGLFAVVTNDKNIAKKAGSQIKNIIRGIYSSPPMHGALLVATILKDDKLKKDWMDELKNMRDRVVEMREAFAFGLLSKGSTYDFRFITEQKGIFSLCGLNPEQVQLLVDKYAIYMLSNGRINIAGLNLLNMDYVIGSFLSVLFPV